MRGQPAKKSKRDENKLLRAREPITCLTLYSIMLLSSCTVFSLHSTYCLRSNSNQRRVFELHTLCKLSEVSPYFTKEQRVQRLSMFSLFHFTIDNHVELYRFFANKDNCLNLNSLHRIWAADSLVQDSSECRLSRAWSDNWYFYVKFLNPRPMSVYVGRIPVSRVLIISLRKLVAFTRP